MAHVELDERKAIREIEKDMGRRLESLGRPSVRLARENTPIDTGQSAASVEYEVDRSNLTLRFGSVLLKYRFLEIGTKHMAARAPLRRTLDELGESYPGMIARAR